MYWSTKDLSRIDFIPGRLRIRVDFPKLIKLLMRAFNPFVAVEKSLREAVSATRSAGARKTEF
jgi:hypothetical protein